MSQDVNEILYLELKDSNDVIIARYGQLSSFPDKFSISPLDNFTLAGLRNIYRNNTNGSIHLIVDANNEYFQGNKGIERACIIYFSLIPKFKQIEISQKQSFDAIIRRFSHNLINFQKRFKDNFSRLISDKSVARPYEEFKNEVERRIKDNTSIAADDICQMSHRAKDLDAQIETLRIISGYADNSGSFLPTNIKKALYRLTNPFVDELKKRNIRINIDIDDDYSANHKVKIVHSLFNASIWHIFDNANKYALKDSVIEIRADLESKPKQIIIVMSSLKIEEHEKEIIFLENRQGKNINKNEEKLITNDGVGIGLFIVRKALKYMNAKIYVEPGAFIKEEDGYPYHKNTFVINFFG